jgi:hypothetical protein
MAMRRRFSANPVPVVRTARRALVVHATVVLALSGFGCKKKSDDIRGSGVGARVERTVGAFTRVKVSGTIRAEIEVGKSQTLAILGDDNLIPRVLSRVEGSTLVLAPDGVLKGTQPLVARVTLPALEGVSLGVASLAFVNGLKAERFEAAGTGGTRLVVRGSARALEVTARSAARLDLGELSAASAKVTAADASRVELGHLESLNVTQTGPSVVIYRGEPQIERKIQAPARLIRGK